MQGILRSVKRRNDVGWNKRTVSVWSVGNESQAALNGSTLTPALISGPTSLNTSVGTESTNSRYSLFLISQPWWLGQAYAIRLEVARIRRLAKRTFQRMKYLRE